MSQSALTVGLIAAAFLLYVAAKGRLPVYTGVILGAKGGAAGDGQAGGGSSGGLDLSTVVNIGEHLVPFVVGGG